MILVILFCSILLYKSVVFHVYFLSLPSKFDKKEEKENSTDLYNSIKPNNITGLIMMRVLNFQTRKRNLAWPVRECSVDD
jgi:hypothetical protein